MRVEYVNYSDINESWIGVITVTYYWYLRTITCKFTIFQYYNIRKRSLFREHHKLLKQKKHASNDNEHKKSKAITKASKIKTFDTIMYLKYRVQKTTDQDQLQNKEQR